MSIAPDHDVAWRLIDERGLPMRCWDGDYVVYNRLSGDTHILDIVTGEVLKTIASEPMRGSALRRHVARFLEVPDDAAVAEQVGVILDALDQLGLIEPVNGW